MPAEITDFAEYDGTNWLQESSRI